MEYTPRTFTLPDIAGLSKEQIELHLGLYQGYVKHVTLLHTQMNKLAMTGEDGEFTYAVQELRRRLGFEWNGMRLHELYFEALEGGAQTLMADSPLYTALTKQYGSFSKWLEIFKNVSARGPGWAILNYDAPSNKFFHTWVADHEIGHLAGATVLLALDHWEHAYLVDYKPADKGEYVSAYMNAVNWQTVSLRFTETTGVNIAT
jgi:Fe-Mn family superoxide dismutase